MDRKVKIIIIDDETQSVEVYGSFFSKRGFDVSTAGDGEKGLQMLRKEEFDVAIVDILMPKLDGISLAKRVATEAIDTSLIILTGHGEKEDAITALNTGVVDFWFEKSSINMEVLLEKVNTLSEIISFDTIGKILSKIPFKKDQEDE